MGSIVDVVGRAETKNLQQTVFNFDNFCKSCEVHKVFKFGCWRFWTVRFFIRQFHPCASFHPAGQFSSDGQFSSTVDETVISARFQLL